MYIKVYISEKKLLNILQDFNNINRVFIEN
jgi:hypothetical protein